jgi:hypothetical protein
MPGMLYLYARCGEFVQNLSFFLRTFSLTFSQKLETLVKKSSKPPHRRAHQHHHTNADATQTKIAP